MIDFFSVLRLKSQYTDFLANHQNAKNAISRLWEQGSCPGEKITLSVKYPDGTTVRTSIVLDESDIQFADTIRDVLEIL